MKRTTREGALEALASILREEQERIYREARAVADQIWQKRAEMKESSQPDRLGVLGVKVRKRTHGISIEWFKHRFYRKSNGGWGVTFIYPRRGTKAKYDMSAFRGAKDWELPGIEVAEEAFAELRVYSAWLSKVGRLLAYHPEVRKTKATKPGGNGNDARSADQDLEDAPTATLADRAREVD